MHILLKVCLFAMFLVGGESFGAACTGEQLAPSLANRRSEVSDFVHVDIHEPLWVRTIFGAEAAETDFRGKNMTAFGLLTILKEKQFDIYWNGSKIKYFDFASGRAEVLSPDGYALRVVLHGAGGLSFIFIYTPGLRRTLEIWVNGLTSSPAAKRILTARSGLDIK